MSYLSETSTVRATVRDFINERMNGADLGYGGDPILPTAIAMDLPQPYATTHDEVGTSWPQHLRGDARNLEWFRDGVLDYVYSSHLLEDFDNTSTVILEWLRVLKPGGKLILCLPDEMKYRAHCKDTGQSYNASHKCVCMDRDWMEKVLLAHGAIIAHSEDVGPYSFLIVALK